MPAPDGEDPALIRSALITHLAAALTAYRDGPSAPELSAWLRPLSTWKLATCLGFSPGTTAARLAEALTLEGAAACPAGEIGATVEAEYPLHTPADRARLTVFTTAVRELMVEQGAVTAPALFAAGFGSWETAKLLPAAKHILSVLSGEAGTSPAEPLPPIERLRRAGERAGQATA